MTHSDRSRRDAWKTHLYGHWQASGNQYQRQPVLLYLYPPIGKMLSPRTRGVATKIWARWSATWSEACEWDSARSGRADTIGLILTLALWGGGILFWRRHLVWRTPYTFFSTLSKNFSPRSYQVRSPGQFKWQYLRNIYDWSVTTVLKGLLWIFSWVDKGISTHKKYIGIFITVTWGQVNMTHGGLTWPVPIKQWENVQKHFFPKLRDVTF